MTRILLSPRRAHASTNRQAFAPLERRRWLRQICLAGGKSTVATAIGALGHGAIEMAEVIADHLVINAGCRGSRDRMADVGDLGVGEGGPRDHGIVGAERPEPAKQRINRRIPGLMRREMGELVGAGDVAHREDIRVKRLERFVDNDILPSRCRVPRGRSR